MLTPVRSGLPLFCLVLGLGVGACLAQTPPADAAVAPSELASTPAAAPPSCAQLSARAMSADVKAVTAQSQNRELATVVQLFDAAITLWTETVERCDGRGRERAQRNLADNVKQRAALAERQEAGAQCEISHRDAAGLQELARQAFGDRRWPEAAALYRKAETMWDLAAEHCSGSQQVVANQRREQSEIDAHNAEFCAPLFDRAREQTQKFRAAAAGLPPADKQQQLQVGESLWREAATQCKGNASELARNNAQAMARERGTPWVATSPPAAAPKTPATPTMPAGQAAQAQLQAGKPTAAAAAAAAAATPAAAESGGLLAGIGAGLGSLTRAPVSLAATPPPASLKELDVQSGDTRYKGQFVREEGQVVSGTGRVEWSNGDAYEGPLLRNQRHGKGEFVWANGQRYKGDWVHDKPTGRGVIQFANGSRFEGQVVDGQPEGEGQMTFASGDQYTGQVRQGVPHGRGLYVWINGQRFDGDWVDDKPQGRGTLRFSNGNVYEGLVLAGKPQGRGRLQYLSGDVYEGEFQQGEPHGLGTYRWKSGERYEGGWQLGLKQGEGRYFWANGDRWEGLFKNDARTDEGVLLRKDDMPPEKPPASDAKP